MRKHESKIRYLIKCIGSKGKVPFWALFCLKSFSSTKPDFIFYIFDNK